MSAQQPVDEAKARSLIERKLEIRAQIQQLRLEARKIDEDLARSGSKNPLLPIVIAAW